MYSEREPLNPPLNADLAALEKQLAALALAPAGVDRDRLMFAAGQASVDRTADRVWTRSKLWPAAATLATAASLMLATMLVWQRVDLSRTRVVELTGARNVEPIAATQADKGLWFDVPPAGYLGARRTALLRGVAALEFESPSIGSVESESWSPPATAQQLRDELLPARNRPNS